MSGTWRARIENFSRDALALYKGLRDPAVPWAAKAALAVSFIYLVSPIDLIPDIIPVIGWLDDLAVLPLAVLVAKKLVPPGTMNRLRDEAEVTVMRWGPRVFWLMLGFVALWILLMGVGGWFIWRDFFG